MDAIRVFCSPHCTSAYRGSGTLSDSSITFFAATDAAVLRRATNRLPNAALAAEGCIATRGRSSCDIRRAAGRPEYMGLFARASHVVVQEAAALAAAVCRRLSLVVDGRRLPVVNLALPGVVDGGVQADLGEQARDAAAAELHVLLLLRGVLLSRSSLTQPTSTLR